MIDKDDIPGKPLHEGVEKANTKPLRDTTPPPPPPPPVERESPPPPLPPDKEN